MAFKKERLEKIIARELGDIIMRDIKDDRIKFVSITNVNLTNDLSIATVFYTVFGNENQIENSSKVFNEAKPYIRTILAKRIQVKKVPELIFKYDTSLETSERIEKILAEIREKEANKNETE